MSTSVAQPAPRRTPGARAGRLPRALLGCALAGMLSALAWSLIAPPFQGPDEQAHVAYVQQLAETGKPPRGVEPLPPWSPEEQNALTGTLFDRVVYNAFARPVWTQAQDDALRRLLDEPVSRRAGGPSNATANPPLYYALDAVPYRIAAGGGLLDRLLLMRMLSVLLAGVTVAFTFLFLSELFRTPRWAPVVGALAVALQPMFGFVAGVVNNDNLLVAAAAGTFWLLAASFRRGLTAPRAAALGGLCAVGVLAKLSMLGLLPGIAAGVALLAWRTRADGRSTLAAPAAAAAAFAVPVGVAWLVSRAWWDRSLFAAAAGATSTAADQESSLRGLLSYVWQFYLPALPGMRPWLDGYPLWDAWFVGFVGRFGWQDTLFPGWAYDLALAVAIVLATSAAAALVTARATVRRRRAELATYLLMALGLLAVIAIAGFGYVGVHGQRFEQGRYLLSLLPLYGAAIVLAARGVGRRLAPSAAVVIVVVLALHGVLAQLLVVGRYYL